MQKNLLKDGYKIRANDISECADCVGWRCIMLSNERPASERKQARMRVDGAGSFKQQRRMKDETKTMPFLW